MSSEGKATSVRLNKADFMKLSRMANATARSRSSVIRQLIRLADVADVARIGLKTAVAHSGTQLNQGESNNG